MPNKRKLCTICDNIIDANYRRHVRRCRAKQQRKLEKYNKMLASNARRKKQKKTLVWKANFFETR